MATRGVKAWLKKVAMVALTALCACSQHEPSPAKTTEASSQLKTHSAEFRQEVVQLLPGIHVAIGYGLANSILIEGRDGLIIVDAMESAEAAEAVKSAFAQISAKPVKALIYTHFHSDHIGGGRILAGDDRPEVYCYAETQAHLNRTATVTRETTYRRAMRQFGTLLPEGDLINAGIGPRLVYDQTKTLALLPPTQTFAGEQLTLDIAGVKLVLMHAPGETPDQIVVWLPEQRVLLPADNFYHSFPNLYAIRGTAYRDVMLWVRSLDRMRALRAEYLVPQHTRPIVGEQKIHAALTDYRDAIQFVHDQTIRWMNRGLPPEAIVERVRLPAHLAAQPYLQEYYGTVAWSVRAIFDGYLGWFGGNATDLFPLDQQARAERFATLAGGQAALLDHARNALAAGDNQWALELADQLLQLDPSASDVRQIKAGALRALGERQTAATARNYYLTQALEVERKLTIGSLKISDPQLIHTVPLAAIFEGMAVKLDPEKSAEVDMVAGFRFPDTGEAYTVHVRRGVAEIRPEFPEKPAIAISVNSDVWKEIAAGARSPAVALVTEMDKEGGTLDIVRFLSLFKED
ncbi:MAG: MBL fold metallo-hydrolase [Desulfobacterales bacterium]|nr:MBL fold metallo-hydrolase [Desulfobacterales bacterium]